MKSFSLLAYIKNKVDKDKFCLKIHIIIYIEFKVILNNIQQTKMFS